MDRGGWRATVHRVEKRAHDLSDLACTHSWGLYSMPRVLRVLSTQTGENMNYSQLFVKSRNCFAYCFLTLLSGAPQWVSTCAYTDYYSIKDLRGHLCRSLELSLSVASFSPVLPTNFSCLDFLKLRRAWQPTPVFVSRESPRIEEPGRL